MEGRVDNSVLSRLPSAADIVAWAKRNRVELALVAGTIVLAILAFDWKGYDFGNISRVVIGDQGDTLTFTSLVYQAIDNLFHRPTDLGHALIYYGDPSPFAYTVAPYGVAVAVLPLYLITGLNLELTMNLYILLTFALTALAVYLLVRYLLDVPLTVAVVSGLAVAFAQFRFIHVAHVETLSTQFFILALYAFHRFLDTPVRRWAIGLAVLFWFTFFTSGYMGYMFFVAVAIILLYLLFTQQLPMDREFLRAAAIFALTAAVLSLPFLAMRSEKGGALSGYSINTIEHYAASPIDWTSGSSFLYFSLTEFANEKALFLGFTPLVLALAGWLLRRRASAAGVPQPASVASGAGGSGPVRRLSHYQVLAVYGTMVAVGYLLTLGPRIAFTETFEVPSPYMLLLQIPGFSSLRVPARFILLVLVGAAVLGAWALAAIGRRLDRVRLVAFYALVTVCLALELIPYNGTSSEERHPNSFVVLSPMASTIPPMATEQPQAPAAAHAWLRSLPPGTPVYNFPATPEANRRYMYFLRFHGQPMLNGQSSFMPRWFTQVNVETFPTRGVIKVLRERKIKYALVHNRFLAADKRAEISRQTRGYMDAGWLKLVGRFDDVDVYEVQAVQPLKSIRMEFDGPIEGTGWHRAEVREGGRSFAWTAADTATIDLLLQAERDLDVVFVDERGRGADDAGEPDLERQRPAGRGAQAEGGRQLPLHGRGAAVAPRSQRGAGPPRVQDGAAGVAGVARAGQQGQARPRPGVRLARAQASLEPHLSRLRPLRPGDRLAAAGDRREPRHRRVDGCGVGQPHAPGQRSGRPRGDRAREGLRPCGHGVARSLGEWRQGAARHPGRRRRRPRPRARPGLAGRRRRRRRRPHFRGRRAAAGARSGRRCAQGRCGARLAPRLHRQLGAPRVRLLPAGRRLARGGERRVRHDVPLDV